MIFRDITPVTGGANGVDTFTLTVSTNNTNRWIIVAVHNSNSSVTNTTPSSTHLTFAQVGSTQADGTNGSLQLWAAFASIQLSSEVITVSATPTGNGPVMSGIVAAYVNCNVASATDVTAGSKSSGANGLSQIITTLTDNDFCIAACGLTQSVAFVAGSKQTFAGTFSEGAFSSVGLLEQNLLTGSPNAVTMSYTLTGSPSDPVQIIAMGLKPSRPSFYSPGNLINNSGIRPHAFSPGLAR